MNPTHWNHEDLERSKVAAVALPVALMIVLAAMPARAQSLQSGTVFEKKWFSCHNVGGGDKRGPDLKGVSDRQPREWLREFIKSPSAMNRKGDPAAVELFKKYSPEVMPDQELDDARIDDLLDFIRDLSGKNQTFVPAGARLSRAVTAADVQAGMSIFAGGTPLASGGAACISCHNVKGIGVLGGGSLGPDLTAANVKYRDPELISVLQNPNFPTMSSVFAAHPLTDEEIVRLFALFQASRAQGNPAQENRGADATFLIAGTAGFIVLLTGADRLWKNRLRGVRKSLVRRRKS